MSGGDPSVCAGRPRVTPLLLGYPHDKFKRHCTLSRNYTVRSTLIVLLTLATPRQRAASETPA